MKFQITEDQYKKIDEWLKNTIYPEAIRIQKKKVKQPGPEYRISWEGGYPYEGAVGGGLQYVFIPTSIGTISKVVYKTYDMNVELDLTDYENF